MTCVWKIRNTCFDSWYCVMFPPMSPRKKSNWILVRSKKPLRYLPSSRRVCIRNFIKSLRLSLQHMMSSTSVTLTRLRESWPSHLNIWTMVSFLYTLFSIQIPELSQTIFFTAMVLFCQKIQIELSFLEASSIFKKIFSKRLIRIRDVFQAQL